MSTSTPPLLFLDVDGPLIPFGATREEMPAGYPVYEPARPPRGAGTNPLVSRIDPALGPRLLALPCTLVWATTWGVEANECVAPWLGLPELPLVEWPDSAEDDDQVVGLHWKTRALVDWADGRPFAWVDDEISDRDRLWLDAEQPGRAFAHRVDPRHGLTDSDFTALHRWLRTKAPSAPAQSQSPAPPPSGHRQPHREHR
ncbi:HAD domain-containing protein [Streptomyces sp. NPDC046939]|uniref:HAD domain-containing protein n=1 Tax=Streptomyces sp. NPDC046939 TaxID=3155376 RepID=UPI0033D3F929